MTEYWLKAGLRFFLGLALWCMPLQPALAKQDLIEKASEKLQKGDIKGAQALIKEVLKSRASKEDQARALKILGISQYLQNNKNGAKLSFRSAVKRDPSLAITARESKDPNLISLFKSVTTSESEPRLKPVPGGAKKTLLKVQSNVAKAQVSIDGIIAGSVNSLINVEPGLLEIEVSSPGYVTKKLKVKTVKDQEVSVMANLNEAKEKNPKKSAPVAKKKKAEPKDDDMFAEKPGAKPEDVAQNLPPPDPTAQFEAEAHMLGGAPAAYPPPPSPYYGGYYPPPGQAYAGPIPGQVYQNTGTGPVYKNPVVVATPFGAGQFQNRSYLLGTAFLLSESAVLAYGIQKNLEAEKQLNDAKSYSQANCQAADISEEERSACQAELRTRQVSINNTKVLARYGFIGFGLLWAGGVTQAIIYDPNQVEANKKRDDRRFMEHSSPKEGFALAFKLDPESVLGLKLAGTFYF